MKRVGWMGWLLAGLVLLQHAAIGPTAPAGDNPLEGRLLQHSGGTWSLYHAGLKLTVQVAELGDQVIEATPTASPAQWEAIFGAIPALRPVPSGIPEPFPGYS